MKISFLLLTLFISLQVYSASLEDSFENFDNIFCSMSNPGEPIHLIADPGMFVIKTKFVEQSVDPDVLFSDTYRVKIYGVFYKGRLLFESKLKHMIVQFQAKIDSAQTIGAALKLVHNNCYIYGATIVEFDEIDIEESGDTTVNNSDRNSVRQNSSNSVLLNQSQATEQR